jgi:OmcA/MtrC family decaheme c-type cytochrome
LYVGYSIPQDGIAKPADFNATISAHLGELLSGAKGTLTGPVNGVYTATITSATVPVDATMVTGLITGYGTLSKGGVNIVFQNVSKVATNYTARRAIVSNAKCNDCHEQLGQKPDFHGGLRNDAPGCQFCHNPNLANNGWAVNSSTFVHGLHGASQRTVPYTWHKTIAADGVTVSWSGEAIGYPGVVRNCEQCHVAGSYDYSGTANRAAVEAGNLLYTTVASGLADGTSTPSKTASMSPYVITGTDYGVKGAGTNLVNSPISAACFSCHDSKEARSHMVSNGGSIYEARSTAILKQESCLVCHGPRGADTTLPVTGAVPTIKTVHRWW